MFFVPSRRRDFCSYCFPSLKPTLVRTLLFVPSHCSTRPFGSEARMTANILRQSHASASTAPSPPACLSARCAPPASPIPIQCHRPQGGPMQTSIQPPWGPSPHGIPNQRADHVRWDRSRTAFFRRAILAPRNTSIEEFRAAPANKNGESLAAHPSVHPSVFLGSICVNFNSGVSRGARKGAAAPIRAVSGQPCWADQTNPVTGNASHCRERKCLQRNRPRGAHVASRPLPAEWGLSPASPPSPS